MTQGLKETQTAIHDGTLRLLSGVKTDMQGLAQSFGEEVERMNVYFQQIADALDELRSSKKSKSGKSLLGKSSALASLRVGKTKATPRPGPMSDISFEIPRGTPGIDALLAEFPEPPKAKETAKPAEPPKPKPAEAPKPITVRITKKVPPAPLPPSAEKGKGKEVVIVEDELPPLPEPSQEDWHSPSDSEFEFEVPPPTPPRQKSPSPRPPTPPPPKKRKETELELEDGVGNDGGGRPPKRRLLLGRGGDPSDSSSSDSSETDLDPPVDKWSMDSRRNKFLTRKQIRQEILEQALREAKYTKKKAPRPDPPQPKRPTPNKPPSYDGDKTQWNSWWSLMVDYMEEVRFVYITDVDKIRHIASFLKGYARRWYDYRKKALEKEGPRGIDSYKLFVEGLKKEFMDPQFRVTSRQKMMKLKYNPRNGGISEYLTSLKDANLDVEMSGIGLICLIREQIPFEIWRQIPGESMITDADEYMYYLKDKALSYENSLDSYRRQHGHDPPAKDQSQGKKIKGTAPKPAESTQEKPSKKATKKAKKQGQRPSSSGYRDPKVWLKNIPKETLKRRAAKNHCKHCDAPPNEDGTAAHKWFECSNSKRIEDRKPADRKVAGQSKGKKRQREDDEDEPSKKQKSSDPKAAMAGASHPRIWESDSPDSDFHYGDL